MKNKFYQSPEPSWLMRQFWKACGADPFLLRQSTYSDQIKYFCLGGIVVATGVMAGLAGGYAIYTVFSPKGEEVQDFIHFPTLLASISFGIVWGLIIFNIDRFIVTSTGQGDGTEAITWQEFKGAIPRIITGMIIALTISKPIEIRIFQQEIDVKLKEKQLEQQKIYQNKVDTAYKPQINEKKVIIQELEDKMTPINSEIYKLQGFINFQIANGGCKSKCKEYKRQKLEWEGKKQKLDEELSLHKTELSSLISDRGKDYSKGREMSEKLDGLLERIKLAHEVAGWEISLFITLLFMVIELTPIFFKLMLIKGPYDFFSDNVKELARAEQGIEVQHEFYKDLLGRNKQRDKTINHSAEVKFEERKQIIDAQREINKRIIEKWKAKMFKDIDDNPDKYTSED